MSSKIETICYKFIIYLKNNIFKFKDLNLSNNNMSIIDIKDIYKLITSLNLSHCTKLTCLPAEIRQLTLLKTFNLGHCWNLECLPAKIGQLNLLSSLDLQWCFKLTFLPAEIRHLKLLTSLNLSWCYHLTWLPAELGQLELLTSINLSSCFHLTCLPAKIGQLKALTSLDLSYCYRLTPLPAELGQLKSLTTLDLSWCNSLTHLPAELGQLELLTLLKLSMCTKLRCLPTELVNLRNLLNFDSTGCNLLAPNLIGNDADIIHITLLEHFRADITPWSRSTSHSFNNLITSVLLGINRSVTDFDIDPELLEETFTHFRKCDRCFILSKIFNKLLILHFDMITLIYHFNFRNYF